MTATSARQAEFAIVGLLLLGQTGCTAFALPRPARVQPAHSFTTTVSVATPPGDPAAWFWGGYCTSGCNRMMASPALEYTYGFAGATGEARSEIGLGANGFFPFVEGYMRLDRPGQRAYGVGARVGIPWDVGAEHQVYARIDLREREHDTLFLNPTLFRHQGRTSGSFTALAAVLGMEENGLTLSVAPTIGWTSRPESAAPDEREGVAFFAVFSASFTIGRGDDDEDDADTDR